MGAALAASGGLVLGMALAASGGMVGTALAASLAASAPSPSSCLHSTNGCDLLDLVDVAGV